MKTNTHIVPFFNKTADLKVGLNQLGLRNASEALFTSLLPGLNNVSNRINSSLIFPVPKRPWQ